MRWGFAPERPMIMTEPTRRMAAKPDAPTAPAAVPAAAVPAPAAVPESPPATVLETQVDEMALVDRVRQGDLAAYDDLVRRYQERIYATIYHMTSNHEDANDLAQ